MRLRNASKSVDHSRVVLDQLIKMCKLNWKLRKLKKRYLDMFKEYEERTLPFDEFDAKNKELWSEIYVSCVYLM